MRPALLFVLMTALSAHASVYYVTVAGLGVDRFDAMVLPYTLEHTNARAMNIRDRVNLECDMIGKYVVRAVELAGLSLTPVRAGDVRL